MRLGKVVIVGASAAGAAAAKTLRRAGFDGTVTLIGGELHRPYRRPPLSKQCLLDDSCHEDLEIPLDEDLRIDMRLGTTAVKLNPHKRVVTTGGGEDVPFDGLIIASGASPRSLPGLPAAKGVHVLRTIEDCAAIRDELRASPKVVVIGGGFIGTEIAASARSLGLEVTLIEGLPGLYANTLGGFIGDFVTGLHREQGTHLRIGVPVKRVLATDRVNSVELADGTLIEADLVVVGVGVAPATDWLEGSGLPLNNGVVCDSTCAVEGVADIVAAGDVARWFNPRYGAYVRVEHWDNAITQGSAAARRLLGDRSDFAPMPYFWSDQFDVKLQFIGVGCPTDSVVVTEGDLKEKKFVARYERNGVAVGMLLVNSSARMAACRRELAL